MAAFSELIKNFDKTRDYIRDFFIYGCKVRSDFDRKSARTYDDERRRAESWLDGYITYADSVRGRSVSITVDSGHISENPLYNVYYSKSFTDNDIRLHFLLLDVMCTGKSFTLREITDILNDEYHQLFDSQTVRNKLKEYTDEGIITAHKQGKTMYYALSPDRTDKLLREFKGLEDALKFYSAQGVFGVIGDSILKAANVKNDLFFIKHNYIMHTLEDILLPDIISAINEKRALELCSFSYAHTDETTYSAVPMQVLVSVQTGRRYLAVYLPDKSCFSSFRLDRIRCVKPLAVCREFDSLKEQYKDLQQKCFGVSFGAWDNNEQISPLKLTIYADEQTEPYIIERLHREKRICTLEKTGEHLYTITADVCDPNEIMHWAKTFIGRIVNIQGGSEKIRETFISDIKRMNEMYGGEK